MPYFPHLVLFFHIWRVDVLDLLVNSVCFMGSISS